MVAISTIKEEYISTTICCAQILWMKQTLLDFGMSYDHVSSKYDNTNLINLSKNPTWYSQAKHIDIRHYFLCNHI